jgi:hypothetical protein
MSDIWEDLAIAVAARLEFERRCLRERLIDEFTVVRFAAEYLATKWPGEIRPGEPHPNMQGAFLDLVGLRPRAHAYDLALEAKWLKEKSGTRQWLREIIVDLFRLQHFSTSTVQGVIRVVLVAGTHEKIEEEIFQRDVQTGGGTTKAIPHLLPQQVNQQFQRFGIRQCDQSMRKWLVGCNEELGKQLPSSYKARLAARYSTLPNDPKAYEVVVWLAKCPKNWQSFDPAVEW